MNEKRYILPPTKVSEFVLGLNGDPNDVDDYVKCNLNEYFSASIEGNHYVPEQVIFTGT